VKHENIYQRIVQHVRIAHVDIIVKDEHGLRVQHQISERKNVIHENIVQLRQVVVVVVHREKLQIQHNVVV
jgi:hypothetical protein